MLKDALDNVLNCIITSSSDPNAVSLTIKGLLITAAPSIMFALGIARVNLGQDELTATIDAFITFVQATHGGWRVDYPLRCLPQGVEHHVLIQLILSRPVLPLGKRKHKPAGNKTPPCRVP
jgi:hypothetical protein